MLLGWTYSIKSEGYSNRDTEDLLNSFHSLNKLNFPLGWI